MSVPDEPSFYNPDAVARDLMMPTGEPAVALIAAGLLVALVFFIGAFGHPGGAAPADAAMAILLAYFAFVAGTLAVIVAAWVGVGDSAATRLHAPSTGTFQQSYDAFVTAKDSAAPEAVATRKSHAPRTADLRARQRRVRVAGTTAPGWRAE